MNGDIHNQEVDCNRQFTIFFPCLKIEQFVHHETDKTWIEPNEL